MVTAIQSLAGDHSASITGSSPFVTMRGKPPSAGMTQACGTPLMFEMKLIHLPSGENTGRPALPTRAIRATVAAISADLAEPVFCAKQPRLKHAINDAIMVQRKVTLSSPQF